MDPSIKYKNAKIAKVVKKNRVSKLMNKNENVLSCLENRLDVVVYRLNLAPNIL